MDAGGCPADGSAWLVLVSAATTLAPYAELSNDVLLSLDDDDDGDDDDDDAYDDDDESLDVDSSSLVIISLL